VTSRGRLIARVKAANEVDGVPGQNGAVVKSDINMRVVVPFGDRCSKQTVEGE